MGRALQVRNYVMAQSSWGKGYPKVRWAGARACQLRNSGPHLGALGGHQGISEGKCYLYPNQIPLCFPAVGAEDTAESGEEGVGLDSSRSPP